MEFGEGMLHESLYLVVAEIADAALVSVVDILVWLEFSSLDFQSHFLVSVAEWHSVGGKLVYFLYREHWVVTRIVEDMLVHFHLIDDVGCHLEAVFQLVESWQEHFLDNLEVAEVAHWQIVHDEHNLLRETLQLVALGAN